MREDYQVFLIWAIGCFFFQSVAYAVTIPREDVVSITKQARDELSRTMRSDKSFSYPPYLGSNYIAQYYVMLHWLGGSELAAKSALNTTTLTSVLFSQQLADGSWQAVPDHNLPHGELDTTIFNYWALKAMGQDIRNGRMTAAREFIRGQGGLAKAKTMTRFWLSLFGNLDWDSISYVPLFVFQPGWIGDLVDIQDRVSQWVYPHLLPMAYLRATRLVKKMPERFLLHELVVGLYTDSNGALTPSPTSIFKKNWLNPYDKALKNANVAAVSTAELRAIVDRSFRLQGAQGSFGAYTVSSLFTWAILQDFALRDPSYAKRITPACEGVFAFIENLYFNTGPSAYMGVLDNGDYWDTILSGIALSETGIAAAALAPTASYLSSKVVPITKVKAEGGVVTGDGSVGAPAMVGIPYGSDFEYAPDVDDTAELVLFWTRLLRAGHAADVQANLNASLRWMEAMQNDNGGFGAFNKNREGWWLVKEIAAQFADSAELFDPSTVDVTAHVMEAFAANDMTVANSNLQRRAVAFLRTQQQRNGMYPGRWGIGYVYGTGSAVAGLRRAGIPSSDAAVSRAVTWLLSVQNKDGGWGETSKSYLDASLAGKGLSTPSQTAWALLGLLEVRDDPAFPQADRTRVAQAVDAGIGHLVSSFKKQGTFVDPYAVGTGHPGIIYMQYPVYAKTWTLMALARYLDRTPAL